MTTFANVSADNAVDCIPVQITHDPLTNLPNRQLIKTHLEQAIRETDLAKHIVALLVLSIDNFKQVNTTFDYDGGDLVLRSAAERLGSCISKRDSLLRQGVDEFVIVLADIHDARDVAAFSERVSRAMAAPFLIREESVRITCSIGIALCPQDGSDAAALLRYANMALLSAQESGRNNPRFFSSELSERALERAKFEAALRSAIEQDQLSLHYQPLVDLQTGQVTGLEALSRWVHPELGMVQPTRFIAVAEACGLIEELGERVLRRVCADMRMWADHGLADIRVSINVSQRQFRDPRLADNIGSALASAGIAPHMLSVEITENALMQDVAASEATLARLQLIGVDLVLDDFGTGFSSISHLKHYPFRKVKIDRSFVDNILTNADDGAIAKAVISVAHSLGIRVVAEGVETEEQCDFLLRNMCDEIQGFLFHEARPAAEVETFLREGHRLPDHLLRLNKPSRTLLLVDDEVNIVAALKRLLRRDNYTILTANSGLEGLEILAKNEVDVIVSDQRMPGMTGVEFLGKAKGIYPDTVRIVLSGYTELQSVTDAVNEGAIYKFLTKPWDDEQLRGHIEEAFRRKEMADENQRLNLEVRTANLELAAANRRLEEVLQQQQQQIKRDAVSLDIVREALQHIPTPVIGLDEEDFIAFINGAAQALFKESGTMLGCDASEVIPDLLHVVNDSSEGEKRGVKLDDTAYQVTSHHMGRGSESRGRLITLTRQQGAQ
jgi:diguanylate cyclase (GGDEF)-like protein